MDIGAWLRELELERYTEAFAENGVDAALLPELTNSDLKDLGVARLADRKRLLKAIASLSAAEGQSGTNLSESIPSEGERRPVTVLFADLTGFTKLSSELGAEETHALLNRYFEAVDGIVESYGGNVDKHMGDNVMAIFGAPVAHGNDPERALRSAGDIHQAMRALSRDVGRELQAHIGIATGQVVASGTGSAAHREYTVTGETVNLASRLQDKANAGETLISDAVCRAVSGLVNYADLGEIEVKGFEVPIRAWRIDGLPRRASSEHLSRFVGRRAQLRQFTAMTEECLETGAGQSMLVRGDAGIGKTRLINEFARIAESRGFAIHKTLVLDFGVGKGQDAIRTLVRSLLAIPASNSTVRRQGAVELAVKDGTVDPDQRVFLNDLLDLPQPTDLRAMYDAMDNATRNGGKRQTVALLIARASKRQPIMLTVEDVHWADRLTLNHLASVASTIANHPTILVMTSRAEGDPLDQSWRSLLRGSPLITIDLGPLLDTEAMEIATGLVAAESEFIGSCIERAEGNPLFLEQLLRNVKEGAQEQVPDTIQSLVLAHMDQLTPGDKRALQAASVIGQRYTLESLQHLLNNPTYDCRQLLEHHLVRQEGDGYLFAHALIRDGVYASLLEARRHELHRKAAQWFAEQDLALQAQHLERAGDASAPRTYLAAAQAQAETYHFEHALQLVERGLSLVSATADRCDLALLRGELLRDLGEVEDSIAAYRAVLDMMPGDAARCRAWIGLAAGMRVADRYDEAFSVLDQAQKVAAQHDLTADLARLHYVRGNLYFPIGKTEDCLREHRSALEYAKASHTPENEARALSGLGDAEYARGRLLTAYSHFRRCLEICREHGFGRIEVANVAQVAHIQHYFKEMPDVLADTLRAIKATARVGHNRAEVIARLTAVDDLFDLGETARAREHLERVQALEEKLGAKRYKARRLTYAAQIVRAEGRRSEALDLLERAIESCRESGMSYFGPVALGELALSTNDLQVREKALDEGEQILHSGSMSRNHFWFYRAAMESGQIEENWDKVDRYASALEDYTQAEPLPWTDLFIARGRALSAFGRGRRDDTTILALQSVRDEARRMGLMSALPALEEALALACGHAQSPRASK